MAQFGVGAPVGRSFEVYSSSEHNAVEVARCVAGDLHAKPLFVEQVEAGKWEVVLEDSRAPLADRIDAWFKEARSNPDPETRYLGSITLLGEALEYIKAADRRMAE